MNVNTQKIKRFVSILLLLPLIASCNEAGTGSGSKASQQAIKPAANETQKNLMILI
jgi:hypothetical protein